MIFVLMIHTLLSSPSTDAIWQLRAGLPAQPHPSVSGGSAYLMAILDIAAEMNFTELRTQLSAGHTSLAVPLAAWLVAGGETETAELYYSSTDDPPATRNDLLTALAWYGRFELYEVMATGPPVPQDMEGRLHSDHCAAICAIGWMSPRKNGLFQGEDLISPGDLQRLSAFFPSVGSGRTVITLSDLDRLFRNERGAR